MSEQQQNLTIQQALDLAVQHHTAGRLPQAENLYQQILEKNPNQPIALHFLGVIAHQAGRNDTAVDLITQALAIKPDLAEAHNNLGSALHNLGKLDDAVASYHKALRLKPDLTEAHNNLGNTLRELGKLEETIASYHKALALKPDYVDVHNNLGVALQDLGRPEEAVVSYRKALSLMPGYATAHNNLGNTLHSLGKLDDAITSFHSALAIKPDYFDAHNNLGNALQELGKPEEAVASYHKALDLKPDYAETHNNLGLALQGIGKLERAVASYRKSLELKPEYIEAHYNLGNALKQLERLDEAIECLKRADPSTINTRASALLLECYYRKQNQLEFEKQIERISRNQRFNFQAASVSAFVSQQLGTRNSYKFCDNPVDLVTVYDLLDTGDVSPDLITEIETSVEKNRRNEQFAPGNISLGFKSIGNLFAEKTPFSETLALAIRRYVGKFLQQHNNGQTQIFQNWPAEYSLNGWYIKMLSGGDITAHVHQGWLSGTFYVRVPTEKENDAGNIEFTLHGWNLPVVHDDFPSRIVATKPGRLVLFPSSLPHRVLPFSEGQDRISIAFDIIPKR